MKRRTNTYNEVKTLFTIINFVFNKDIIIEKCVRVFNWIESNKKKDLFVWINNYFIRYKPTECSAKRVLS